MMNQLPAVLQKEIWEYVRGDRAYWKQQFSNVMAKIRCWRFMRISRPIQGFHVTLDNSVSDFFDVCVFENDKFGTVLGRYANDRKFAIREFEIWTKIFHREFGQIEVTRSEHGHTLDHNARQVLLRAKDEWQARSDSS
jgi:hypothetical protein